MTFFFPFLYIEVLKIQVAQSYADDADLMFFETSAKTGENIEETFLAIGKNPLKYYL
jgi:hypothetical protein